MALSFREFVRGQKFISMFEDDAPPPVPTNPEDNPEKGEKKKHSFRTHFQDEFDVDDETMDEVEPTEVKTALKPFKIPGLGFQPAGPIPCITTPRDDGKYDVTVLLSQINKRKATKEIDGKLYRHHGEMKDVIVVMNAEDLDRLRIDGWDEAPPGGGPPGMGGGPPGPGPGPGSMGGGPPGPGPGPGSMGGM